jgi:cholesterol oxidase
VSFRDLQYGIDGEVGAPVLVLAAGSLGSTRLLLKNRKRLLRLSPALGTRFSGNGDALSLAIDPQEPDVKGARADYGPTMTSRIDLGDSQQLMVADGGLPESFGGLLQIVRGIGRDAAEGRMRLTPIFGCFDIRWSKEASAALFERMRVMAGGLAEAAGATSFFALDAGPLGKFITVHPLGGCAMSDDPSAGVIDDHGYDGLYVLDGSIVQASLGVNPSKTIAALAERGAEHLAAQGRP